MKNFDGPTGPLKYAKMTKIMSFPIRTTHTFLGGNFNLPMWIGVPFGVKKMEKAVKQEKKFFDSANGPLKYAKNDENHGYFPLKLHIHFFVEMKPPGV